MARPGRKPLSEAEKKQKLTLSLKPENITYLNTYCKKHSTSISQLLDELADQLRQQEQKAAAKAAREARKAGIAIPEQPLPGQMEITDFLS